MSATPAWPLLFVDCSQRASILGLAVQDAAGAMRVTTRVFEPSPHAEREAFWDELRALAGETGVSPDAIRAVAVAVGPGGFTGLRVSVAFAKAFALARGIPAIPVPSAALFAASDRARGGRGPWLVALASKAQTAWAALVDDPLVAIDGDIVDASALATLAAEAARAGGALLADDHLDPALAACASAEGVATRTLAVEPRVFAEISAEIHARGGAVAPAALLPVYAREPEAVTNWRARAAARRG